jgi:hypothetical protein
MALPVQGKTNMTQVFCKAAGQLGSVPHTFSALHHLIFYSLSTQKLEYPGNRFFTVKFTLFWSLFE